VSIGQTKERRRAAGECRECSAFCDKLVDPAGCMEMGCEFLYSYEDISTGRRFFGCINKVFKGEIDLDDFLLAERAGGYGGIKMTGEPLPQCQFRVERAYEGDGPAFECVNKRFFDCAHEGPEGIRAFDLRNTLTPPE
jgi:hypothetical protein